MPLAEAALGAVVTKVIAKSIDAFLDLKKEGAKARIQVDDSDARSSLISQLHSLENWASSISLMGLLREKALRESFVELSLDIGLIRVGAHARHTTAGIADLLAAQQHVAITGRPGAGKTTSLQRIAQISIEGWQRGDVGVPILARLRDLRGGDSLVSHLLATLGISLRFPKHTSEHVRAAWERRALMKYLDAVSATLLIDGLDETPHLSRALVESDLIALTLAPGHHRVFLTCRTAEYHLTLQRVQVFTIRSLTAEQVADFATRWLGEMEGREFLQAVRRNPYAGTEVVPLTLAHLCALYERDGELPERPVDVYEQIVSLLVEQWDRQRGVQRFSRYADFTWRKKERFLQAIAYELAIRGRKGSFRESDLEQVYVDVAPTFRLPVDEATAVVQEVESHTGLIQQSGERQFDFVHLAIQEFLIAMHAYRKSDAIRELIPRFPNEMALVVAFSTDPEDFLERVLQETLSQLRAGFAIDFVVPFLSRLALERAIWHPTVRCGWTMLAFLSIVTRHLVQLDDRARLRLPIGTAAFFADEQVQRAIGWALVEASRFEEERAYRFLPNPHAQLPPFLGEYLASSSDAGLLALRGDPIVARALKMRSKRQISPRRRRR